MTEAFDGKSGAEPKKLFASKNFDYVRPKVTVIDRA